MAISGLKVLNGLGFWRPPAISMSELNMTTRSWGQTPAL